MEQKEEDAESVTALDEPTDWISELSAQAADLAAKDAAFFEEKVAEIEGVKTAVDFQDPTEGMDEKEEKNFYSKALSDAKTNEKAAKAAAKIAAKEKEAADKDAASKAEDALKKKEAAEAAKEEARAASLASKKAKDTATAAAKVSAAAEADVAAASAAVEQAEADKAGN